MRFNYTLYPDYFISFSFTSVLIEVMCEHHVLVKDPFLFYWRSDTANVFFIYNSWLTCGWFFCTFENTMEYCTLRIVFCLNHSHEVCCFLLSRDSAPNAYVLMKKKIFCELISYSTVKVGPSHNYYSNQYFMLLRLTFPYYVLHDKHTMPNLYCLLVDENHFSSRVIKFMSYVCFNALYYSIILTSLLCNHN